MSELGYLFLTKSSLHIIAWDLDVKDQAVEKSYDVKSCNTIRICYYKYNANYSKARVLNKPYIYY